jgi:hypothetical protein
LKNKYKNNKLFFLANSVKEVISLLDNFSFLNSLGNDFFNVLYGAKPVCQLRLNIQQKEELLLFILYMRMVGGLNIFTDYQNGFYFINFDVIEENYLQVNPGQIDYRDRKKYISAAIKAENENDIPDNNLKDIILNQQIENYLIESGLNTLVILTHNRSEVFKVCLEHYINNLKHFKHQGVRIIVSDDSDLIFARQNEEIVEKAKERFPNIEYISPISRDKILTPLIEAAAKNYPQTDSNFFKNYIPFTFAMGGFPSTYGRNRNFVSFYLKGRPFVSVDDDSKPQVLTYSVNVFKEAVKKLVDSGNYDLNSLYSYIPLEETEKQFVNVDFFGYFKIFNRKNLQYTRYSGHRDINLFFYFISELGFNPETVGAFEVFGRNEPEQLAEFKKEFPFITFIYKEKENKKLRMQGLCCYFPAEYHKLRVTIPENLRIEDLCFGANYFLETGNRPVETNFAIYHDKQIYQTISATDIHFEILSTVFFELYLQISVKTGGEPADMVFTLYDALLRQQIVIPEKSWQYIENQKKQVTDLYKRGLKQAELEKNSEKIYKVNKMLKELEPEFYSLTGHGNKAWTTTFINDVMRKYINSMVLWFMLNF